MYTIEPERPDDAAAIDALLDISFGPGRYAKTAYRFRDGVDAVASLSLVSREDGVLRGSLRFWPVVVGRTPVLLLGPLAVQPDQRGRGIGIDLMRKGLELAKEQGHRLVMLVGDEPYYARIGFKRVMPVGRVAFPGPVDLARLLYLELEPGAFDGVEGMMARPALDRAVAASSTPVSAVRD